MYPVRGPHTAHRGAGRIRTPGFAARESGHNLRMPKQVDTADVRALIDQGAQVVEVLPETAYTREHLPGAVNIPFTELGPNAVTELDAQKPTIVYCYDRECDLSARAAYRFETLGFTDVYDYVASKAAWMACGLPIEGTIPARSRAGAIARDAPRCSVPRPHRRHRVDAGGQPAGRRHP